MAQVSDVHLSGLKCQTERRVTDWRSSNGQQCPRWGGSSGSDRHTCMWEWRGEGIKKTTKMNSFHLFLFSFLVLNYKNKHGWGEKQGHAVSMISLKISEVFMSFFFFLAIHNLKYILLALVQKEIKVLRTKQIHSKEISNISIFSSIFSLHL